MTKQTGTAVLLEGDYGSTVLAVFADGPTVEDDVAAYRQWWAEEYLYHDAGFSEPARDKDGNRIRVACGDIEDACAEMEDALHSRYTADGGVRIYAA